MLTIFIFWNISFVRFICQWCQLPRFKKTTLSLNWQRVWWSLFPIFLFWFKDSLCLSLVWQNIRDTYNRCLFNIRKLRLYKRSRSSPFCVQGNLQTCRYFCTHSHRAVVTCSTYRNDAPYHLLVRYIFLNLIEFRRGGFHFSSPHFFLLLSVFKLKTRQRFQQQTARVFFFFLPLMCIIGQHSMKGGGRERIEWESNRPWGVCRLSVHVNINCHQLGCCTYIHIIHVIREPERET